MPALVPDVLAREYPRGEALPVVFDSPHSGRRYPADFGHIAEELQLRRAEDAYIDRLYFAAPEHGATLIHALFPRSYIDSNRGEDQIDQTMLDAPWPQPLCASAKTELGRSLIWKRYAPGKPMYARRLRVGEVERRHSLQIEVNRKLYMEENTIAKHAGFARLQAHLSELVQAICAYARSEKASSQGGIAKLPAAAVPV